MPINNNLEPVSLPMDLKFGQDAVTHYINNLESLNIELIDGPTREQAQKIAWHMTKATWADKPSETSFENATAEEASINLQDEFLSNLIEANAMTAIYLKSGIKLHGKIVSYDQFTITLKEDNIQLIYKHAVATIVPIKNYS